MDGAQRFQLSVADVDDVFGQQGHGAHIRRPDDVSALRDLHAAEVSLLLDVKKCDAVVVPEKEHSRASKEDLVAVGHRHLFRDLILQVFDDQLE